MSNCRWDNRKHMTVCAINTRGLEECLSVIPKSLCTERAKGKLVYAKEESAKPNWSRYRTQSKPASVISPKHSDDGQVSILRKPEISQSTRETEGKKVSYKISGNIAKQQVQIQNQSDVSIRKTNEERAESSTKLSKDREPSGYETRYIALTTHKASTWPAKSSTTSRTETATTLPVRGKLLGNNIKTTPQNLTVSLFQRGHNTTKISTNSNETYTYTSRQKISGSRFRCRTSIGHYRTSPEQRTPRTTKSARFVRCRQDSDTEENFLMDSSIADFAAQLEAYVIENNFYKFQSVISSWDPTVRQRVINYKAKCNLSSSVFFRACQLSRVSFVTLMLKECSVDLELTGVFNVPNDDTILQVTPLWYAAASSNLDLVRLLTSHGANINAASATGCSVVRAACCVSNVPIVTFLITQGADIHAKNIYGVTCLMNAILSPEITKLLIYHGSKINEVDIEGNTALHYAAEAGRLDTVQVLIEVGANPKISNNDTCHVIETAAKYGQTEIVDYLIKVATPSLEKMVDVFFILGSVCIIMDSDYSTGYLYWHKAFELKRLSNKIWRTRFRQSVLADVLDMREITFDELWRNRYDHEKLSIQALFVYERIRGALDDNFLNLLIYRGAVSADNKNLKLAMHLWKTAYKLHLEKCVNVSLRSECIDMFNGGIINILRLLLKILDYTSQEMNTSSGDKSFNQKQMFISEDIIGDMFQMVCQHVSLASDALKQNKHKDDKFRESFVFLLKVCLAIFYGYLKIFPAVSRRSELGTDLQKVICLNPRGLNNETLLHMCLDCAFLQSYGTGSEKLTPPQLPSFVMLEILLMLGADPLARDARGNTVLHLAVLLYRQGRTLDRTHLNRLLCLGVHVDQVNHQQEKALDLLPPADDLRQILQQTSLKCLAARSIVLHRISYTDEVPKCLYSFIELHAR